jgi:hypothetical protein
LGLAGPYAACPIQARLRSGCGSAGVRTATVSNRQQPGEHGLQIETPVEAVLELGQVAVQVGLPDPAGHAHDVPLQVPRDGIHPGDGGVPPAPPATRHLVGLVLESGLIQEAICLPPIREDGGARGKALGEPGLQFPAADIPEDLHPHVEDHGGVLRVGLDGHDEGSLASGAPAPLTKDLMRS